MSDQKLLYEGMFLLSQQATSDLTEAVEHVKGLLARAEAEVIGLGKWDDRKLAYQISGQRRGTFLLSFFKAPGRNIARLDRDCNLSDVVLRSLILRADHVGEVELEQFKQDMDKSATEAKLRADAAKAKPAAKDEADSPAAARRGDDDKPRPKAQPKAEAEAAADA